MRLLSLALLALASLLFSGPLRAQLLVIDPFTDNTEVVQLPGNITSLTTNLSIGQRTITGNIYGNGATVTTQVNNGWITTGSASGESGYSSNNSYFLNSPLNISATPYLQLQVASVSGSPIIDIQLTTASDGLINYVGSLDSSIAGQWLTIDVRTLTGYHDGDLDDIQMIILNLQMDTENFAATFSQLRFAAVPSLEAVPEPSSWALALLIVAMLGLAIHRRRLAT